MPALYMFDLVMVFRIVRESNGSLVVATDCDSFARMQLEPFEETFEIYAFLGSLCAINVLAKSTLINQLKLQYKLE